MPMPSSDLMRDGLLQHSTLYYLLVEIENDDLELSTAQGLSPGVLRFHVAHVHKHVLKLVKFICE